MLGKARMIGIGTALAACLFGATAGFSEDAPPPRMRGTIDQVNGNAVTVKTRTGLQALSNLKTAAPWLPLPKARCRIYSKTRLSALPRWPNQTELSRR